MQSKKWGNFSVRNGETDWMVGKHQFCHKTLPETYHNKECWLFSPIAGTIMKTWDRLGVGFLEIQAITSSVPFGKAWGTLANPFSPMATYRTVSSRARLFWCQEAFSFQCRFTPGLFLPFVLVELSLELKDPSFLVFVFLIIFIDTNHESIKDVHIDPERKKKPEQHVWRAINNWGGWGGLKVWNLSLHLNFKCTAFGGERGMRVFRLITKIEATGKV